jgi:hypothetical protein
MIFSIGIIGRDLFKIKKGHRSRCPFFVIQALTTMASPIRSCANLTDTAIVIFKGMNFLKADMEI